MRLIDKPDHKLFTLWTKAYYAHRALGIIVYRTPFQKIITIAFWSWSLMIIHLDKRKIDMSKK